MNMHTPQTEQARAECMTLMSVEENILSPQASKPVISAIQDALLGSYLLTKCDTFLSEQSFMDYSLQVHYSDQELPTPAILKPKRMYTGKQLFTYLTPREVAMQRNPLSTVDADAVCIRRGTLHRGQLAKRDLGSSQGGIVHSICVDINPYRCMHFLSDLQRCIAVYLHQRGFSIGVSDCIVPRKTHERVTHVIERACGHLASMETLIKDKQDHELAATSMLQNVLATTGQIVLGGATPGQNSMLEVIKAGSKGSNVNIAQICACVGQVTVAAKRIHHKPRSLPCFRANTTHPIKHGFCPNSFISGLNPQEYVLHAMGGREGLVDTAVKTATTGYIQRRLVKNMESMTISSDLCVRDVQCGSYVCMQYGGDSYDARYMERAQLPEILFSDAEMHTMYIGDDGDATRMISMCRLIRRSRERECHITPTQVDMIIVRVPFNLDRIFIRVAQQNQRGEAASWNIIAGSRDRLCQCAISISGHQNSVNVRAVIWRMMRRGGPLQGISVTQLTDFEDAVISRMHRSCVQAGFMAGAIASHSIGEPTTQMTLNTFHTAGVKSVTNITLGVQRFKEIIDCSDNMITPVTTLFLDTRKNDHVHASTVAASIIHRRLVDVAEAVDLCRDDDTNNLERDEIDMRALHTTMPSHAGLFQPAAGGWFLRIGICKEKLIDVFKDDISNVGANIGRIVDMKSVHVIWTPAVMGSWWIHVWSRVDTSDSHEHLSRVRASIMKHTVGGVPGITGTEVQLYTSMKDMPGGGMSEVQEFHILATGRNLEQLLVHPGIDPYRSYSNDITEVNRALGIDAGGEILYSEMRTVLEIDGVRVNLVPKCSYYVCYRVSRIPLFSLVFLLLFLRYKLILDTSTYCGGLLHPGDTCVRYHDTDCRRAVRRHCSAQVSRKHSR